MQEETTPIFKCLWYDWTQQQPGIEPTNPLGQYWVPPIVAIYDQQGLLATEDLFVTRGPPPWIPAAGVPAEQLTEDTPSPDTATVPAEQLAEDTPSPDTAEVPAQQLAEEPPSPRPAAVPAQRLAEDRPSPDAAAIQAQ